MQVRLILSAAALFGGSAIAVAQTAHSGNSGGLDHAVHHRAEPVRATTLTEPGQGAFAALSEVVRVLEADPATDWSLVDLDGLRAHLVDMDRLVSDAEVTQTELPDGIAAQATGDAQTVATLRRMVPAHATQLSHDERWAVTATGTSEGVELRVTSEDPAVVARIKGLGFFELMASQDHHRDHHLMIARGEGAPGH